MDTNRSNNYKKNNFNLEKSREARKNFDLNNIKCFKCGNMGHFANKCREQNKKELNTLESHNFNDKLDERVVTIEGLKANALFDSGATNNIVSGKLINSLKNKTIIKEEKSFKLINGDVFTTKFAVPLKVEYNDHVIQEKFHIIQNSERDMILCNETIKKLFKK